MKNKRLQKLVVSALFLSMALVSKTMFSFYLPVFGQNGTAVGISGIFSILPSILFGPWYGMAVSGLSDFLGYVLKPSGAYMPLLTLTAALGGFLRGWLWLVLKKGGEEKLKKFTLLLLVFTAVLGVYTVAALNRDGLLTGLTPVSLGENINVENLEGFSTIGRLVLTRSLATSNPQKTFGATVAYLTMGPLLFAGLVALLLLLQWVARKGWKGEGGILFPLLFAALASGLVVTTLNTVVLRELFYTSWKAIPFFVVWLPRVFEEVVAISMKCYFVAVLYNLALKIPSIAALKK